MKKKEKEEIFKKWDTLGFLENDLGKEFNTKIALMYDYMALTLIADSEKDENKKIYSERMEVYVFPVLYRLATRHNMIMSKRSVMKFLKEFKLYLDDPDIIKFIHEYDGHYNDNSIDVEAEVIAEFCEKYGKTL